MTEKQLIKQLKSLKNVCLDCTTKKDNREVLFSQISAQSVDTFCPEKAKQENRSVLYFKNFVLLISRPALVFAGLFLFLIGATVLTSGFYKNSKPNDSLYIARIISEKIQLNTTFSQPERQSLALKFSLDRARDITEVLLDPEFNTEANKNKVEKLNSHLQQEISKAKVKAEEIKQSGQAGGKTETKASEQLVQSASNLNEGERLELYLGETGNKSNPETNLNETPILPSENVSTSLNETSTETEKDKSDGDQAAALESSENLPEENSLSIGLSEIEKLSNEGQLSEVLNKLNEVQKLIK